VAGGNVAAPHLQALHQGLGVALDANNLNQRLERLHQWQQAQAQAHVQRRLRLLRLQQENLGQQGELVPGGEGRIGGRQDAANGGLGL
jgi:hypothetical protein